ncbi:MAG: prolyl oligopeptidase family serine peptidase [Chlamydiae bacterium]|nr:prolyl oligopeptidase family serine peptidase [Chlamydiota bacterium]
MKLINIISTLSFFIIGAIVHAEPTSPITYEDIVQFSKPQKIKISPDGSKIAYVVQSGNIEKNETVDTLYFYDIKKETHSEIIKTPTLMQMNWDSQNNSMYILTKENKSYSISQCSPGKNTLLVNSCEPITIFQVDNTDTNLVYAQTVYDSHEVVQNRIENGYVYQWGKDDLCTIACGSYRKRMSEKILLLHLPSKDPEMLTEISYAKYHNADIEIGVNLITKIAMSPDMRYIAFDTSRIGQIELGEYPYSNDIVIWDQQSHMWISPPGKEILGSKGNPCWIDSQKLVFQFDSMSELITNLYTFDCGSQVATPFEYSEDFPQSGNTLISNKDKLIVLSDTGAVIFSLSDNTYETIELPKSIFTENSLISPSIDNEARFVVTFSESSNIAPEVVLYDTQTKEQKTVSNLNPWLKEKQLGAVEKILFTTKNGIKSTGYLVHPVNEKRGVRYPLIIGTYGFSGGFILDAEWHSTFPSQVLASDGYLVLLLNIASGCSQNLVNDPVEAMKNTGWNSLELFESAVDQLVEQGIADPEKVGLYGWSHGGFMVNFLISHSSKFQSACYGEGADYNPSEYWISGKDTWSKILDNTFGGPPWGETLQNYVNFCPFFNIEKINTPVLIEYADIGTLGYAFEMYVPMRLLHKPAELVLYKDEMHNFVHPKARIASMKRKVDWFDFWLLNKKDSNPAFKEQYDRWEAMKNEAEITRATSNQQLLP